MSQRIVYECDRCAVLGREPGSATPLTLALLDGKTYDVDLCDVCVKDDSWSLLDWQSFVSTEARPIVQQPQKRERIATGEHACPATDCGRSFSSAQGLATHCARAHDRSLAQLRGEPTPYACQYVECPLAYPTPEQLRSHVEKGAQRHKGMTLAN